MALIGIYQAQNGRGCVILEQLVYGLLQLGHTVRLFDPTLSFDYVLVFNTTAHINDYDYNNIAPVKNFKFAFIDCAEYGWKWHYKEYDKDFYNCAAPKSLEMKNSNQPSLLSFLQGKSFPYFLREMREDFSYPKMYHPIDYPFHRFNLSTVSPPNFEEYMSRPLDLYVNWGNSHPFRHEIIKILENIQCKKEIHICNKINQKDYFNKIRTARIGISFDGYGYGSFREKEILSRALLFINKKNLIEYVPLETASNCVQYSAFYKIENGELIWKGCDIKDLLERYMQDWKHCYEIYKKGYDHCMQYYTEKAMAQYVLDILQHHDFTVQTPISLL